MTRIVGSMDTWRGCLPASLQWWACKVRNSNCGCKRPPSPKRLFPVTLAWIVTIKDGCVCVQLRWSRGGELFHITNRWLVFMKYAIANLEKWRHSSGALTSAEIEKKKKKRWDLEVGAQPLWIMFPCHCAPVARGLDFDTADYWWNSKHVPNLAEGPGKKGTLWVHWLHPHLFSGMVLSDLCCQDVF